MGKEKKTPEVQMATYDPNGPMSFWKKLEYSSGDGGYHFIYNWINVFLTVFCTDTLGVPAGVMSALLLYVRFFDAINDPIIGNMADRTRTRWGRYRPWILWGAISMGFFVAALFNGNPNWSTNFKIVYVCVLYVLITIASTCENMAYGAMNGVLTANPTERLKLGSQRMVFMYGCAAIVGFVQAPLVKFFSNNTGNVQVDASRGWGITVTIFCVLGVALLTRTSLKIREAVPPANVEHKKMTLADIWTAVIKNPPLMILTLGMIVYGVMAYGRMAMFSYYFKYYCGNAALMSTYSLLNGIFGVLGAFSASTINKWIKSKGTTAGVALILMGLMNCICFWIPATNSLFFVFMAASSYCGAVYISTQYGIIPDAADYGELVSNQSLHGFTNAFTSLGLKIGGAVGPAIGVAILAANNYVPNVEQSVETLKAMNVVATIGPGLVCVLGGIIFLFYPLNPARVAQMRKTLDERRSAALQAQK